MSRQSGGLRIGIDGTCLASPRGYGRFLRELLPPLLAGAGPDEYVLFVDEAVARTVELPDMRVERLRTRENQAAAASGSGARSPLDMWRMRRGVMACELDVFYFPSVFSWFPLPRSLPTALTIHDTIPERHADMVFPRARNRWAWSAKSWAARHQARTIITISDFARRQIADLFGTPESAIHVAVPAPSAVFGPVADDQARRTWLAARGIDPDLHYFLFVGGVNPHKNVEGLVRGLATLEADPDGNPVHLLLVGAYNEDSFHADTASIRAEVERSGLAARVHWPGFASDPELRHLYAGAVAVVLPAFEEGFGLPAVEAAACGTPCIATRQSPLPEVLEGAGLFFDPWAPQELADALKCVWSDPGARAAMATAAIERATALDWTLAADATRAALHATAGSARP